VSGGLGPPKGVEKIAQPFSLCNRDTYTRESLMFIVIVNVTKYNAAEMVKNDRLNYGYQVCFFKL